MKGIFLILIILMFNETSVLGQNSIQNENDGHCQLAMELIHLYQFEQAIEELNLCYSGDIKNIDYLSKLAQCQSKLGHFKKAKNLYLEILSLDSINSSAHVNLATIYSKESNYSNAIKQYAFLIKYDSTKSYYFKQSGLLKLKTNDINGAIGHLERAYRLNEEDIEVLKQLGDLYLELNLPELSMTYVDQGLTIDSMNISLLNIKTKIYYKNREYKQVISTIDLITKNQKDTSLFLIKLLGVSHLQSGNYEVAITHLENVLEESTDSETIHYYLGHAYLKKGDYEKSVYHFEKAINSGISDNISEYYTNLALVYEQAENYAESIKAYQAAYRSSQNKILLYHLARNYDLYYEDKKTALDYYEKYLALNDSDNIEFMDYSKHRIYELKNVIHFNIDTLE